MSGFARYSPGKTRHQIVIDKSPITTGLFLLICIYNHAYATDKNPVDFNDKSSSFYSIIGNLNNNFFRSHFKQQKKIKILNAPLLSEGKVIYSSDNGIIWETSSPIQSKLIISDSKIFEISTQNKQITKKLIKQTGIHGIYTIFQALLTGNTDIIRSNFSASYQEMPESWIIYLSPLSSPLNKIFDEITLTGNQNIKSITFNETNQDSTRIEFFKSENTPSKLTPEEEADFGLL